MAPPIFQLQPRTAQTFAVRDASEMEAFERVGFPLRYHAVDRHPVEFESELRKVGRITAITMSSRSGFRAIPTEQRDLYSVSFTVTGTTVRCCASREAASRSGTGSLYHLHELEWLDVSPRFKTVGLLFEADLLEGQYRALTGAPATGPIDFEPVVDLHSPAMQLVADSVRRMHAAIFCDEATPGLDHPLLQELLVQQLLALWPRMTAPRPAADASTAGTLERARAFIAANLAMQITVADVAAAAGTSVRALQMSFRKELGLSPVSFILAERLDRAHLDLGQAADGRPVSQIAYQCGFLHMSDFSRRYRDRFGCTPSETRRDR